MFSIRDGDSFDREEFRKDLPTAARIYADGGWKVHPCYGIVDGKCACGGPHTNPKDMGKHPRLNEWQHVATNDVETVRKWWTDQPDGNLGVFCRPSGFFVIDIDPRSGGDKSFLRFEAMSEGALPDTVEALTGVYTVKGRPVRGRHRFYRCDESEQLVGNLGKDLKGVDIKHNGYVLIAPSNHASGVQYEWVPGHAPWEMEIAEAPEELLALLRKRGRRSAGKRATGARTPRGATLFDDPQWAATWEGLKSSQRLATPYAAKVLKSECARIKKLVHGDRRNEALNNAAMRMGHLIGGRQISLRECREALADAGRTSYKKSPGGQASERSLRRPSRRCSASIAGASRMARGTRSIRSTYRWSSSPSWRQGV